MRKYLLSILGILLIGLVSASCSNTNDFTIGDDITICTGDCVYQNVSNYSQFLACDSTIKGYVSASYSNGSLLFQNKIMSLNGSHYEFNASDFINQSGLYYGQFNFKASKGWDDPIDFSFIVGSASSPSSGGGSNGGGSVSDATKLDPFICNVAYTHILENGQDPNRIPDLQDELKNIYGITITSQSLKDDYVDYFQFGCSKLINRTLKPELVCNITFDFASKQTDTIDNKDILNLRDEIYKSVPISSDVVQYYVQNYNDVCSEFPKIVSQSPESKNNLKIFIFLGIILFILAGIVIWSQNKKKQISIYSS